MIINLKWLVVKSIQLKINNLNSIFKDCNMNVIHCIKD